MRGGVAISTGVFVVALVVVSNVFAVEVSNGVIDDKHFLLAHKHGPFGGGFGGRAGAGEGIGGGIGGGFGGGA
ncbi:hypothetical protein AMTRI_Chr06g176110 [Amborella trichopoda]